MSVLTIQLFTIILFAFAWVVTLSARKWGFASLLVPILLVQRYWLDVGFYLKPYLFFGLILTGYCIIRRITAFTSKLEIAEVFRPIIWFFFVMIFFMILSILFNNAGVRSIRHLLNLSWVWLIVISFIICVLENNKIYKVYDIFPPTIFFVGIISCIYYGLHLFGVEGVASVRSGAGAIYQAYGDPFGRLRLFCLDPNHLAAITLPIFFSALGCYHFKVSNNQPKRFALIALLLGLVTLILTFSRGGALSLSVGLIFYFSVAKRNGLVKRKKVAVVIFGTLFAVLIFLNTPLFNEVLARYTFRSSFSSEDFGRLHLWINTMQFFGEQVLLGVGQGNLVLHLSYQAHNTFIEFLVENGIFAFISFAFMLLIVIKRGLKETFHLFNENKPEGWLLLGSVSSTLSIIIMMTSLSILTEVSFWFYFFFQLLATFKFQARSDSKRNLPSCPPLQAHSQHVLLK